MARNYYYSRKQQEPKLVNVISVPAALEVTAVYDDCGSEIRTPIFLIGIFDNGSCGYLETSRDGEFDRPERAQNFIRFEYCRR